MGATGSEEPATCVFILVGALKIEAAVYFIIFLPIKLHGTTSQKRIVIY
jgi:hypothetical protein